MELNGIAVIEQGLILIVLHLGFAHYDPHDPNIKNAQQRFLLP